MAEECCGMWPLVWKLGIKLGNVSESAKKLWNGCPRCWKVLYRDEMRCTVIDSGGILWNMPVNRGRFWCRLRKVPESVGMLAIAIKNVERTWIIRGWLLWWKKKMKVLIGTYNLCGRWRSMKKAIINDGDFKFRVKFLQKCSRSCNYHFTPKYNDTPL